MVIVIYTTAENHWAIYCSIGGEERHHGVVVGPRSKADRIAAELNRRLGNLGFYHVKDAVVLDED